MRLLLTAIHLEPSARAVPLGPAMLAAMLNRELPGPLETRLLDLYLTQTVEACVEEILAGRPQVVGFSTYVWNRERMGVIAARLKEADPALILFAGGPEATTDPVGMVAETALDFVLIGEAEEIVVQAMAHLLAGGDPAHVAQVVTPQPVADLATLPSPFLDGTLDPAAYSGMLWELSRGCPFKCDFCFESRGTPGVRRFPMARIRAELQLFARAGVEQIFVLDPTFNHNRQTAKEILQLIREEAPQTVMFFEVRSESIDEELAALFASIDCSLQIGLQSASNAVLGRINRKIDPVDFEAKVLLLHEAGASYGLDLIYGLPGDDFEGFCASLDFAAGLAPNHLDVFPLAVLPGTRLHETAASLGLVYQAVPPYQVLSSTGFTPAEMARAAGLARAVDRFYNEGGAVPWFGMVTRALELSPSELCLAFATWCEASAEVAVVDQQCAFLEGLFAEREQVELAGVVGDVVRCFALCDEEDAAGEAPLLTSRQEMVLELLEGGVVELADLAAMVMGR